MFAITVRTLVVAAAALVMSGTASAQTNPPPHTPLQKTIGAAKPEVVPSLFVLNSKGAALQAGKLVLTGVSPNATSLPIVPCGRQATISPAATSTGRSRRALRTIHSDEFFMADRFSASA